MQIDWSARALSLRLESGLWSDLRSTWQADSDREGVFLYRLSSRCGPFNPELHCCCYELGIHQTPRHHNTGDCDSGFDRSDHTCCRGYLGPLTRLYDATKRYAKAKLCKSKLTHYQVWAVLMEAGLRITFGVWKNWWDY